MDLMQARWQHQQIRPVDQWILGADLGQSNDPTAICALHHRIIPDDPLRSESWIANDATKTLRQKHVVRFDVRHLERLPLGMPYPSQVHHIGALLQRPPLNAGCTLVIDETGVGRPVGDLLDQAGLRPERVTITSGLEATRHGCRTWHVPKSLLISNLEARLHVGELKIAANLRDASALQEELKDFNRSVSAAGRSTYGARTGKHDDLVLAVAIALWTATNSGPSSGVLPIPFLHR